MNHAYSMDDALNEIDETFNVVENLSSKKK
jgi:hypothetical protein